jgi:protein O-mannosyl-transferase
VSPSAPAGRSAGLAFALALACGIVNAPSLTPGFIHDDQGIVEQNALVRDGFKIGEIFSKGYWSVGDRSVPNLYRPVTILSFALNHAVGGASPLGYRLVNLVLHILVTLLVFALGRRLFGAPERSPAAGASRGTAGPALFEPAFLGALLFAVHPAHTEVLGLVVGRAELLAAVGTLGCVLAFLRGRDLEAEPGTRGTPGLYVLSIVCFVFGALAKENALAAPFLVLLADLFLTRRRMAWRYHAAALATLGLLLMLRAGVVGGLGASEFIHRVDNPIAYAPFLQGRLTALKVLVDYVVLLIAPVRMSIDYSFDAIPLVTGLLDPMAILGGVIVVVWVAGSVFFKNIDRGAAYSLAWIGVSFAPTANLLVPIGTIMAERLLYLPSVGFCLLAAAGIARLLRRLSRPVGGGSTTAGRFGSAVVRTAVGILVLALAARSVVRLRDWRDNHAIFKAAIAVVPNSVRALYNYGTACEDRGEDREAAEAYGKAIALWPAFVEAHYNLAGVHARRKEWDEAARHYREALRERPDDVPSLVNLGHALNGQGRSGEAVEMLRRAIEIDPRSDEAYTTLGAAHLALGDPRSAAADYAEAIRVVPENADYQRNLGLALQEAGDAAGAAGAFERGLRLRPGDPDLLAALGIARLQEKDTAAAVASLEQAVAARPAQPIFRYQLARAMEQAGRRTEAAAQYREAIRLAPSVPVPQKGLGLLLYRMGDRRGALEALERAAALDPTGRVMDEESRRILAGLRSRPGR